MAEAPNRYCERLRIPPQTVEAAAARPGVTLSLLMVVALLEREYGVLHDGGRMPRGRAIACCRSTGPGQTDRRKTFATGWHEVDPSDALREAAVRFLRVHPLRACDALQLAAAFVASER